MTETSLYVHVPFCASKCAYCDFCSLPVRDERWHEAYVEGVMREIRHWRANTLDDVPTLYIGGGTPTVLGERLVGLVAGINALAGLREGAEVTVEANPDSVTPELVAALAEAGVNRVSLGVQSFDDAVLRTLGRIHDADAADRAAGILRAGGMRFSVDVMCGIPGQTLESWLGTLERAIGTGAGHVSAYPLSVEEGTPLYVKVRTGELPPPDPDVAAEMMITAEDVLGAAGLERYEVASYARPGEESRHNVRYWTGGPYIGVGPSAASMLPALDFLKMAAGYGWDVPEPPADAARARFTRSSDVETYVYQPVAAPAEVEYLTRDETAREDVMLGLRLAAGVDAAAVAAAGLTPVLEGLAADGLVELAEGRRWRTTRQGWLLGNEVFGRVWTAVG